MKKPVLLVVLMIFLFVSLVFAGDDSGELTEAVKRFINHPSFSWTEDKNSPELRETFLALTKLAEKAEWQEIDEVSILLETTKKEVEEKSRELSLSYLIVMHKECQDECSPEVKKKLDGIYNNWKFEQDIRLGRFFYVIRAFQPRIAVLETKAKADEIRNSRLLSYILEIKSQDTDEQVLAKRQAGIAEFERRKGR